MRKRTTGPTSNGSRGVSASTTPRSTPTPPEDVRFARIASNLIVVSWPSNAGSTAALTPAEGEVVALASAGNSNAQIAAHRKCAERTVANLLARAYRKLGVASRAELAAKRAFERDAQR